MSYKYKESIISDLVDMLELPSGVWRYTQKLSELDEVYAKAQAFDEIVDCLEKQVAYGLKDSEVLSEIDYLIEEELK